MGRDTIKSFFAVHEAVILTGFSKYMLDYFVRAEIFIPSGQDRLDRGVRRRYTYEDVVLLRALNVVCTRKGKVRHLRKSLETFRSEFGPLKPGKPIHKTLFVDGDELSICSPTEGARQVRTGQRIFSFVADLSLISQEIAQRVIVDASGRFRLTPPMAKRAEEERQRIWEPIKASRQRAARRHA